jgi:P27 family predicted phage terminase small subunit
VPRRSPTHLAPATAQWWRNVVNEYALEEHHERLLTLAAEAYDRAEQARDALGEHGLTFTDKAGRPHARPEVAIERDSRIAFARLTRELDLDGGSAPDVRPPRRPG